MAKFIKRPEKEKPFECICLILERELLSEFVNKKTTGNTCMDGDPEVLIELENDSRVRQLFQRLTDVESLEADDILTIKRQLVDHLIANRPQLGNILCDFTKPWKIDLEPFMNRNFRFKIGVEKLAYMTGRSLATFKRDFKEVFNSTPQRWIQSKRLEEAYYLLSVKEMKPVEIYQNIGFESLSHFSYAFKRFFGVPPSRIATYQHKKSTVSSTY